MTEQINPGQIWQLGEHRLMCGDSLNAADVDRLMDGAKAELVFTDPPYGMGKASRGITNDNLYRDALLEFNRLWIPLSFGALKDNGSWYCWGKDEPLMDIYSDILKPMIKEKRISFRNLITWNKADGGPGQGSNTNRCYAPIDEKCLFVMCGPQELPINAADYFEGFEPVRQYMADQKAAMGWTNMQIREICGVTSVDRHCFSKSQFQFITEPHYQKLQAAAEGKAFLKSYADLSAEYEQIKAAYIEHCQAFYDSRAYFDNTHDFFGNVWTMPRATPEERKAAENFPTLKPLADVERAIKSSSREGDTVLDLFGGAGSTLIACERLGRACYMMELAPKRCQLIVRRWERETGKKAEVIHG